MLVSPSCVISDEFSFLFIVLAITQVCALKLPANTMAVSELKVSPKTQKRNYPTTRQIISLI